MRSTATGGKRWQEARRRCSQRSETFRGVTRERRTEIVPDGSPTVEADARADGARRAEKGPAQRVAGSSQAANWLSIGPGSNINQSIPPATEARTTEHKERSHEL
jgi:hypothetical protein